MVALGSSELARGRQTSASYFDGYELFSRCSGDFEQLSKVLTLILTKKALLPAQRGENCFLDIGSGNGLLTSKLSHFFDKTVFFEPNPFAYELTRTNLMREGATFDALFAGYTAELVQGRKFNLIAATNVLYHIEKSRWANLLHSVRQLIITRGLFVVTLWSDKSELYENVFVGASPTRKLATAEEFLDFVEMNGNNDKFSGFEIAKVYEISSLVMAKTESDAEALIQFLFRSNKLKNPSNYHRRRIKGALRSSGIENLQKICVLQAAGEVNDRIRILSD